MIRTQVQLTEGQATKLKRLAVERGVSMAEVIRDAIDGLPERDDRADRWKRALAVARRGYRDRDGASDVSTRHDEYLAEILTAELRKS